MTMKLIERLKTDKKFLFIFIGLVIATLFIPYATLPALFLWWFYKKSKFSKKFKIISTSILGILLFWFGVWVYNSYSRDPEPHLNITEPALTSTVNIPQITIKGTYDPTDRKVWVNDKEIPASNGSFETVCQLKEGENKIEVSAGDWKRTTISLAVKRELSDEERTPKEPQKVENVVNEINKNDSQDNQKQKEIVYTLDPTAVVDTDGGIKVDGVTNLPDGALLDVAVNRVFTFEGETDLRTSLEGRGVEMVSVLDGKFNAKVTIDDEAFKNSLNWIGERVVVDKNVQVVVIFDPTRQNLAQKDEVLLVIGKRGEKLEGSAQKIVIGEKTESPFNQLEVQLNILYPIKQFSMREQLLDQLWRALDRSIKIRKGYDIQYEDLAKRVTVIQTEGTFLDETAVVRGGYSTLVAYGMEAFKITGVNVVKVVIKGEFTDVYGKNSIEDAVRISMSKTEFDKYDWKNLEYQPIYTQMENSATEYYVHPAVLKNLNFKDLYLSL